jgi:myosin heavy subunit
VAARGAAEVLRRLLRRPTSDKWQKRLFVAKDGFLLYYSPSNSPTAAHFDTKPKGVIPLGGCTVDLVERGPGRTSFGVRIQHPDFYAGRALILAAETERDQIAWKDTLLNCSRVTMENALLGDSIIEKLRAEGSGSSPEQDAQIARLQEEAMRLRKEKDDFESRLAEGDETIARARAEVAKRKELEEELARERAAKAEALQASARKLAELESALDDARESSLSGKDATAMSEALAKADALEKEREKMLAEQAGLREQVSAMAHTAEVLQKKLKEVKDQSSKLKEETRERRKLERKLQIAEDSVKRLDDALRRSGMKMDVDVFADVKTLLAFFEERAESARLDAQRIEIMKKALKAKKRYIMGMGEIAAESSSSEEEEVATKAQEEEEEDDDDWGDGESAQPTAVVAASSTAVPTPEAPPAAAAEDGWESDATSGHGAQDGEDSDW